MVEGKSDSQKPFGIGPSVPQVCGLGSGPFGVKKDFWKFSV
jgi:hypothetical protein